MPQSDTHLDFIIEFAVQSLTLFIQASIVIIARDRYKSYPDQTYHRYILWSNIGLSIAIIVGMVMSGIAYSGFERDYYSIWSKDSLDVSKFTFYELYRSVFASSLFIYIFSVFGLFCFQLRYFVPIFFKNPKSIGLIALVTFYLIAFCACLFALASFNLLPKSWEDWQAMGQQNSFYVQSSWAVLVGLFEITIAVYSKLKLRKLSNTAPEVFSKLNVSKDNDEYVAVLPPYNSGATSSAIYVLVILLDILNLLGMFCVQILGTSIFKTFRQQMILFKFANLSVTIHFALSMFYLDLGRQYLAANEIERQEVNNSSTFTTPSSISPKAWSPGGQNIIKERYLSDLDRLYNEIMLSNA